MGTRASFWIGDPRGLEHREWLGCVAWDGYAWESGDWALITTEVRFRDAVAVVKDARDDFADPACGGWPFPWTDDIFLTDYTYAFFDGAVHYALFHSPFMRVGEELPDDYSNDPSMNAVLGPSAERDRSQPDSIRVVWACDQGRSLSEADVKES